MISKLEIQDEIRSSVEELLKEGKSQNEVRSAVQESLQASHNIVMRELFNEIVSSPEIGLNFAHRFQESIGYANEVLFDYSIVGLHIKDFNSPVVRTIEEVFQADVLTVLDRVFPFQGGLH
jgi:hypothetical protein